MSEPDVIIAAPPSVADEVGSPTTPPPAHAGISHAEWMLIIATVIWGSSFALAKGSGEAINAAAGVAHGAIEFSRRRAERQPVSFACGGVQGRRGG